ncbi:Ig-like domain repeat protein [Edaphobacter paludis]|uniref:Ig-like domain repeat protein n=1 Tax=Edaphobacter paludis TaxID=3035702 RepID=A0AAU7DAN4_9BACT
MGQKSIPQSLRRRVPTLLWMAFFLFLPARFAHPQTQATNVPLILPSAITYDSQGNLYIAETGNHIICKVAPTGIITTIAGTGTQGFSGDNSLATAARLDSPQGLAVDANILYIADTHNHRIRKLDLITGIIVTIAGSTAGFSGDNGAAAAAQFNLPTALTVDANHNLYIADTQNHRIRKITAAGLITTVAGNGVQGFSGDNGAAIAATIDSPAGLAVDAAGDLYLSDTHNHRIRKITAASGLITTIAGASPGFSGDNGPATAATLALPHGLSIDSAGNLYIADTANHRIRRIDATTGAITTVAGNGTQTFSGDEGLATTAALDSPRSTVVSPAGLVTLADTSNQRVRQLDVQPAPNIHTIAGLSTRSVNLLTLTAPPTIVYGTGQLTASLASPTATGSINFTLLNPVTATGTTLETEPLTASTATFDTSALPVGTYSILAAYTGDPTHPATQSQPLAVTITPRPLVAVPDPITLLYGQPIPILTGSLIGDLPQDDANLTSTFTAQIAPLSPAATYPISATLTGAAAKNYMFTSSPASVTIVPAPTLTTLIPSATSITAGIPITFTAQTVSTTSGIPSGTVTFKDGATTLLTAPIPAIFTTTTLSPGPHTITTLYGGDRNFIASTSAPALITVIPAPANAPDFTLTPTGAVTQTIPSGGSVSFNFSLQIQGSTLSSPITLAATGLPPLATASFTPGYLPPGTTPNTFILTISTPQTTAFHSNSGPTALLAFLLFPLTGLALRLRIRGRAVTIAVLGSALVLCSGCGSRINTGGATTNPVKTYTITITGTATSPTGSILQHATTVSLLVESVS